MARAHEIDFTSGPLLKKIIIYALPVIGVNMLQLLFSAADIAVLGNFLGDAEKIKYATAAVGATTQIINLAIGFFVGLSVGANVLVARAMGAKNQDEARRLVGTSMVLSLVFGLIVMAVGVIGAKQFLIWTNCPANVLDYAARYLRIYFFGMPIIMLYNFSAAILRAVGDTMRPLIFLMAGGVLNVGLNIFFVAVLGLDVEGVAVATVASQAVSAIGALVIMLRSDGYAKIERRCLRINKISLKSIFAIGIPMGISKCTFSLANNIIYASINALDETGTVMSAHGVAKEFDGFILEAIHGISIAAIAVVSQNLGAKNMPRIKRTVFLSLGSVITVATVMGALLYIFGEELCGFMLGAENDNTETLKYCMVRVAVVGAPYVLCGIQSVIQESIRGLGYSNVSLSLSVFSNIIFRVIWVVAIYPFLRTETDIARNYAYLCLVWPISWILVGIVGACVLAYLYRRTKIKINLEMEEKEKQYA